MESEKIYYGVVILICAASMLLSPFFYIRMGGGRKSPRPVRWKPVVLANLVMLAALAAVWWKWF